MVPMDVVALVRLRSSVREVARCRRLAPYQRPRARASPPRDERPNAAQRRTRQARRRPRRAFCTHLETRDQTQTPNQKGAGCRTKTGKKEARNRRMTRIAKTGRPKKDMARELPNKGVPKRNANAQRWPTTVSRSGAQPARDCLVCSALGPQARAAGIEDYNPSQRITLTR